MPWPRAARRRGTGPHLSGSANGWTWSGYAPPPTVTWWQTLHPAPKVFHGGLDQPGMKLAFFVSLAAFTVLLVQLVLLRLGLERLEDESEARALQPLQTREA